MFPLFRYDKYFEFTIRCRVAFRPSRDYTKEIKFPINWVNYIFSSLLGRVGYEDDMISVIIIILFWVREIV